MTPGRSLLCGCILPAAVLATAAHAQEEGTVPGAISDPSTYQGSMALQQQSDAQDQQFRQEQEQAAQQRQQNYDYAQQATRQPQQPSGRGYAPAPARRPLSPAPRLSSDPAQAAMQRGDYATAFRLTHDAAVREGYLNAMKNLGSLYEHGLGTRTNPQLAVQWYRTCADLGAAACQAELARIYYLGIGVQRDPVEAYKWLLVAGRPGGFKSALMRQNIAWQGQNAAAMRRNSAVMRNSLSYAQLSEATRRYQLWAPAESVRPPEQAAPRRRP